MCHYCLIHLRLRSHRIHMYGKFGSRNVTSHPSFTLISRPCRLFSPTYTEEISRFSLLNLLCSIQWPGAIFRLFKDLLITLNWKTRTSSSWHISWYPSIAHLSH